MSANERTKRLWGVDTLPEAQKIIKKEIGHARSVEDILNTYNKLIAYATIGRNEKTAYSTLYKLASIIDDFGTQKAKMIAKTLRAMPILSEKSDVKEIENKKIDFDEVDEFYKKVEKLFDDMRKNRLEAYTVQGQNVERVKNIARIAIVMAATGLRINEVLVSANLFEEGGKLFVTGLLKKKGKKDDKKYEVCKALNIANSTIIGYLKKIRKYFKTENMKIYDANAKWNGVINRGLRRMMNENVTAHDFRAKYAQKCLKAGGINLENATEYIAKFLRHEVVTTSATHYKK